MFWLGAATLAGLLLLVLPPLMAPAEALTVKLGAARPVPAVGGMMGMPPSRFLTVDLTACLLWAPAFLLPGVLFGASLEVASEYTGRLTVILVILLVLLWITWWAIRAVYEPLASRSARWVRHLIRWSRRHPVLDGRPGGLAADKRDELQLLRVLPEKGLDPVLVGQLRGSAHGMYQHHIPVALPYIRGTQD